MGVGSRRLLPVFVVLWVMAGCTPVSAPVVSPAPSFRCTPEAGGDEFDCSQHQYDEMVAKDALYAEAEAVYRKFLAEDTRIMRAGGVTEPTEVLLETTSGEFLEDVMGIYRTARAKGLSARGSDPALVTFRRQPDRKKGESLVAATTCVDNGHLEYFENGKSLGRGTPTLDENYFSRVDGGLKLIGADGKQVESCI